MPNIVEANGRQKEISRRPPKPRPMREKVKHTLSANRHLFFCLAARVPLLCGLNFVCVCFGWTSAAARCCCPLLLSVFCVLLFCCGWYGPTELRLGSLAMSKHHRPYTISFSEYRQTCISTRPYHRHHGLSCLLYSGLYAGVRDTWETALFRLLWLSNAIHLST